MNTSLIISESEFQGLINLRSDAVSTHLQQLAGEICIGVDDSVNIVSTLSEKRLASWDGHTLTLEPFLKLIIDEACNAIELYSPEKDSYALECPNMHLLFTRYEWAENVWRIAPYKDKSSLILSVD